MTAAPSIGAIWPSEPATPPIHVDRDLLARVALTLTRDFAGWVRRRVETVSYVADTTVRRQISVDFVLPHPDRDDPDDPLHGLDARTAILVPLGLPKKEPVTHFDVWDETGRTLSLLNTRENGDLAERALRHLVEEAGASPDVLDPDGAAMRQIREIATIGAEDAQAVLDIAIAEWLGELFDEGESERILFEDLANSFMLLVPARYAPGQHRVIKYAYDESLDWAGSGNTRSSRISRFMVALGLQDKSQSLEHPIGLAEGYHVEIVAPEEVVISDAWLSATQWTPPDEGHPNGYEKARPQASIASQRERAHLNVTALAPREDSEKVRGDRGRSVFTLRARRSGTFRALLAATTLLAALIFGARWRLGHLDDTTAAAVLLVFPAVVAVYLARPGEHAFATRLLAGVRAVALLAAISGLAVAGMLGSGLLASRQREVAPARVQCPVVSTAVLLGATRGRLVVRQKLSCKSIPARTQTLGPVSRYVTVLDWLRWIALACAVVLWLGQLADHLLDRSGSVQARRRKLTRSIHPKSGKEEITLNDRPNDTGGPDPNEAAGPAGQAD